MKRLFDIAYACLEALCIILRHFLSRNIEQSLLFIYLRLNFTVLLGERLLCKHSFSSHIYEVIDLAFERFYICEYLTVALVCLG